MYGQRAVQEAISVTWVAFCAGILVCFYNSADFSSQVDLIAVYGSL
ncbi:hypothetical protein [Cohaesibacter gelatinilyticus]|nr:hypothetical protein [Cohaesibacter gelatinilyticus]